MAELDAVRRFREEYAAQRDPLGHRTLRARARRWAGRISGRADRRLVFSLAGATDALIERYDVVASRIEAQEALLSEVTRTFGSELTHLRAEVAHLRAAAPPENVRGD